MTGQHLDRAARRLQRCAATLEDVAGELKGEVQHPPLWPAQRSRERAASAAPIARSVRIKKQEGHWVAFIDDHPGVRLTATEAVLLDLLCRPGAGAAGLVPFKSLGELSAGLCAAGRAPVTEHAITVAISRLRAKLENHDELIRDLIETRRRTAQHPPGYRLRLYLPKRAGGAPPPAGHQPATDAPDPTPLFDSCDCACVTAGHAPFRNVEDATTEACAAPL